MKKVYIASPFFNEEQLERVKYIERLLKRYNIEYFSPRIDTRVKPDSTDEERKRAFADNIDAIKNCEYIIVVTDGKDIGTMFEAGFAYSIDKPILYFAETLGNNPFNLMLAMSANAICKSRDELDCSLRHINDCGFLSLITAHYEGEIE